MKNTQIFKVSHVQNEPHNLSVYVNYDLEDTNVETWIKYEELSSFLSAQMLSHSYKALSGFVHHIDAVDEEYICEMDEEHLKQSAHEFLFKNLRIDLIIENRKLKDRLDILEEKLKKARTGGLLINAILINTFEKYRKEAIESKRDNLPEITMINHALYHGKYLFDFFKENVIDENN